MGSPFGRHDVTSSVDPSLFRTAPRLSALRQTLEIIRTELNALFSRSAVTPTGALEVFAGDVTPPDRLACDGRAVSRQTYLDLFGVIGTRWGAGDGATTFNLPNIPPRYRFAAGGSQTTPQPVLVTRQATDSQGNPLVVDGSPVMETVTVVIDLPLAKTVTTIKV
ncbi:tail fiber protein [Azospirillum cavernae]|uniref:Tail fiber protein n=1 Tax=Azospirillum cavernae TaxID=2320860 RepID=A0A418W4V9_9PROT|nr:tail fiber protein [Azospirillum cavernae]